MQKVTLRIKKLDPLAKLPVYGSESAAGADLYALAENPIRIAPGETAVVHTGLAAEIPEGYAGFIYARSGLASKKGLAPANKVGVIDSDYRGEIRVALHNHSACKQTIEPYERVAQLVIAPYVYAQFEEVSELSETVRGEGGFGSTGQQIKRRFAAVPFRSREAYCVDGRGGKAAENIFCFFCSKPLESAKESVIIKKKGGRNVWQSMYAACAATRTTKRPAIPITELLPARNGKIFPMILPARCAA